MIPHRDSTIYSHHYSHGSQRPSNGSVSGRKPLNLVINQRPFRSFTARTVETESPESEAFSPDTPPPMPPRPPPSSQRIPGNSGSRRQSTQRTVYETSSPPLDYPSQSRPPIVMPMPTPGPAESLTHPPAPARPRPHFPGGSVGGFAVGFPPTHGQSRGGPRPCTPNYACRFGTTSSRSQSGLPRHEPTDISGGIHADVWPTYNKISQEFDEKILSKWNTDLDVLLIFVSPVPGYSRKFCPH